MAKKQQKDEFNLKFVFWSLFIFIAIGGTFFAIQLDNMQEEIDSMPHYTYEEKVIHKIINLSDYVKEITNLPKKHFIWTERDINGEIQYIELANEKAICNDGLCYVYGIREISKLNKDVSLGNDVSSEASE